MRLGMLGDYPMELDTDVVPADQQEASFMDKVREFKRKADEMWNLFTRLRAKRDLAYSTPETRASYDRVMGRAERIIAKVEEYVPQAQAIISTVGSMFGAFGMDRREALGQLGIPMLAIFGIGALITTMTVWISDAYVELQKLEAVQRFIDQGMTPTEATEAARGKGDGGLFDINIPPELIIGAGAAIVLLVMMNPPRGR